MRPARAIVLALALAAGLTASATAQTRQELEAAKRFYERGDAAYENREYAAAAVSFRRAFDLSKRPLLLFNAAQAYRLAGDPRNALLHYQEYLRLDPTAPTRPQVEQHIGELEKLIGEEEAGDRPPAPPPPPPPPPRAAPAQPVVPEAPPPGGHALRVSGVATAAAGLASIGTSIVLGLRARASYHDITELSRQGGQWSEGAERKLRHAGRDRTLSIVLGAAGGAALAGGGILYYLGWRQGRGEAVALLPLDGGALVVAATRF